MKHKLDESLDTIKKLFSGHDPYAAHIKAHLTLTRMAADDEVIYEIIRRALISKKFDENDETIDFQICLFDTPECTMFVSFFGPHATGDTSVSYSPMHDHDDFLLSTINAKGPGYDSLIFQKGFTIDPATQVVDIALEKFVRHHPQNIEFIDSHTAHTLFFPSALTMTYALWSNDATPGRIAKLKNSQVVQKNKTWIKNIINKVSINVEAIGIPVRTEDYFYPEAGKIKHIQSKVQGLRHENWVQNYFHILQNIGFGDKAFLKDLHTTYAQQKNPALSYVERLIEGDAIARNYEGHTAFLEKRNVPIAEYHKCFSF